VNSDIALSWAAGMVRRSSEGGAPYGLSEMRVGWRVLTRWWAGLPWGARPILSLCPLVTMDDARCGSGTNLWWPFMP
jgi:hypothetical protein